jgi:alkaline phosphatase D
MAAFRLLIVSDTHLSRHKAYCQDNWEAFLRAVPREAPDLVVMTGDLCFDALEFPDDLAFARGQLDRMGVPWLAIPGNHDIGDQPPDLKFKVPVDALKRGRWLDALGADWWLRDVGDWRLIGLNGMLPDSALPAEAEQWRWLDAALAERGGREVLLCIHKPLFVLDPDTVVDSTQHYAIGTRRRLLDLSARHGVRAIVSGHLHRRWAGAHAGVELIWAPSAGFIMGGEPPRLPIGETEVGYVMVELDARALSHRFVCPSDFAPNDMAETMARLGSTVHMPLRPWVG